MKRANHMPMLHIQTHLTTHSPLSAPTHPQGAKYNIPVVVWLPEHYPQAPPLPYVVPSPNMTIKGGHPYVDGSGQVTTPSGWGPKGGGSEGGTREVDAGDVCRVTGGACGGGGGTGREGRRASHVVGFEISFLIPASSHSNSFTPSNPLSSSPCSPCPPCPPFPQAYGPGCSPPPTWWTCA